MILAGDIGGTKTVLALYETVGKGSRELRPAHEESFSSKEHDSFQEILDKFLDGSSKRSLASGCFGVAGPVINGRCHTTNLPWTLDEGGLAEALGVARVKLLNDVQAAAYGVLYLEPGELTAINAVDARRQGNMAVIAAGTGLGEAFLYWDGTQHHPVASEGGHTAFAPRTDQEMELLRYLRDVLGGHVSYERLLSGPGLHNIYEFLRSSGMSEPGWVSEKIQGGDPAAVISKLGLAGEVPLCVAALDLFCSIYGAEAGNLMLKTMAVGGVVICGGIAPKILPALKKGGFMEAFADKGRFSDLVKSVEVRVALNPRAPLIGAAHYGLRL